MFTNQVLKDNGVESDNRTIQEIGGNAASPAVLAFSTTEDSLLESSVNSGEIEGVVYGLAVGSGQGRVTINADGTFSYEPGKDFAGSDSFVITADDGSGNVIKKVVNVWVNPVDDAGTNDVPVLASYEYATEQGVLIESGLFAIDPEGDPIAYDLVGDASHGTVELNPNGTFTYQPDPSFTGVDTFLVAPTDGLGSKPQEITVYIGEGVGTPIDLIYTTTLTGAGALPVTPAIMISPSPVLEQTISHFEKIISSGSSGTIEEPGLLLPFTEVWGIDNHGTADADSRDTDIVMDFRRFDATEDNRDRQDVLNLVDLLEGENQNTIDVNGVNLDIGNLADYIYIDINDAGVNLYIDHNGTGGTNAGISAGAADTTATAQLTAAQTNADLLITLKTRPDIVVGTSEHQSSMLDSLIGNSIVVTDTV